MPSPHDQLVADLHALGVQPGDILLVHSSLRALGHVDGGAPTVIDALQAALGPDGTLLMPALSHASVTPANPVFDVRHTPACVGTIPETFRTSGALRSVHPTHSVCARGQRAAELLADHHRDITPCGPHSPFAKLPAVGGKILMLGCGLRPNTSMHVVEELADPPYLFGPPVRYRIILADGSETKMTVRSHNFAGVAQRYDRIETLLKPPALAQGTVLQAQSWLIDARAMWHAALNALANHAMFFVEPLVP